MKRIVVLSCLLTQTFWITAQVKLDLLAIYFGISALENRFIVKSVSVEKDIVKVTLKPSMKVKKLRKRKSCNPNSCFLVINDQIVNQEISDKQTIEIIEL